MSLLLLGAGGGDGILNPADFDRLYHGDASGRVIFDGSDRVSDWGELGLVDTATQATDIQKPIFFSAFEGAEALQWDGGDDRLAATLGNTLAPVTIALVSKIPSSTGFNTMVNLAGGTGDDSEGASIQRGSDAFPAPGNIVRSFAGTNYHVTDKVLALDNWDRIVMQVDTSAPRFRIWFDGVEATYSTQPALSMDAIGSLELGSLAGTLFFDGYMRELIIFGELVDALGLTAYFDDKWPA